MPKRPRDHFFRNPARRPRTGPIGLDSLPPTLVEQVLSYIYPEGCLDCKQKSQLQRMAERMFEGFAHNHQVMVFGRQALDVLTASGSLRDGMWHYRERLDTFQGALHDRFVDYCRWQLSEQSTGPVPHHEFRALQITVDRREPCEGRELILEQVLLRPKVRSFGRSYCDDHLEEAAGLDRMTSDPVELTREQLDGEEAARAQRSQQHRAKTSVQHAEPRQGTRG